MGNMNFIFERFKSFIDKFTDLVQKQGKSLKIEIEIFTKKWGSIGYIAMAAVIAKYLIFYHMMGVNSSLIPIMALSLWITLTLFRGIGNKWISTGIYLLLSFLMLAIPSLSFHKCFFPV